MIYCYGNECVAKGTGRYVLEEGLIMVLFRKKQQETKEPDIKKEQSKAKVIWEY